ncbi:MAG: exonuclease domain-containing protein, partial [Actinobacteria bacterium]|nr:exonuclease domain-containing protein [Actinomycetota bacterium]
MAFDLETTGVDPQSDEIIEIAAVRVRGGQVVGEFSELCDPGRPIPLKIRRLTGISPEMLDGKPAAAQVLPAFLSFAGGGPLVAHNSDFDRSFLVNQLARIGRTMTCQVYDSLELARILLPLARNHRLGSLAAELGLPLEQGHRALDDARAAAALMVRLWAAAAALDHGLLSQIVGLAGDEPWPLKDVFSSALAKAATRFQDRRISREFASAEEAEELPDRSPVDFDPDQLKGVVGAKGPLAARLGTYEDRPGQAAMLELVARALEEGRHAVVEAGTGTGKSIAYLIPSLYWSLAKGERVVVSTHTINLQEQLWEKDLPLLAGCLDLPFRAALVKGRSNYLCLRRFKESVDQADFLSSSERRLLVRVLTWVKQTTTGDRSELNLFGEGEEAWVTVCSESESCLGVKCPWQSRHCFFYRARRRAERADLIVANHALVFADVQSGNQILPPYSHLILDEAHHIEDVATEHLGTSVSHGDVRRTLTLLFRGYNEQGNPGFLANLRRHYGSRAGTSGAGTSRPETAGSGASGSRGPLALVEDLIGLTQSARQGVDELFMALSAFVRDSAPGDDDGTAATLRLKEEHRDSPAWKEVDAARANATGRLRELSRGLARLGEVLERGEEDLAGTEFAG